MSRLHVAWIQIRSQIGPLAMAVVVIALGVALAEGMLLANAALRAGFDESLAGLVGRADIEVSVRSGGTMDEALLEAVRGVDGVAAAAPLLLGMGFVESRATAGGRRDRTQGAERVRARLRVVGVDMLDDASVRVYRASPTSAADIDDPLVFMNQPDSALIPRAFLDRHGYARGAAIEIETSAGRRRLVVRGVLADEGAGSAFGGELVVMDLYAAQEALGAEGRLSQVDVVVATGESHADVAARLRDVLPEHVGVRPTAERRAELARTTLAFQRMLDVIAALGLVLAMLITASRLGAVFQHRSWEMGVLRGLGWTPTGLLRDLLLEGALLSLVGALLGAPLGLVVGGLIVQPIGTSLELNLKQAIAAPPVRAQLGPILLACGAGTIAGTLAAALPARRAARTSIATLKAKRRRRDPTSDERWKRRARRIVPAACAAMIAALPAAGSGPLGGVAMIALVAAGALLVAPALRVLGEGVGGLLGPVASLGVRDQSRAASRARATTGLLMIGVGLVVWIGATARSFERYVTDSLMGTRHGDLIVDSALYSDGASAGSTDTRLPEGLTDELARVPGVALVGAEVVALASEPTMGLMGVDPIQFRDARLGRWRLAAGALPDALALVARGEAVLANRQLMKSQGLTAGDMVRVMTPSGPLERRVAGVNESSFLSPQGDIVLSRELYRRYWHDRTVTRVFVALAPGASTAAMKREIEAKLARRHDVRVIETRDLAAWFAESVRKGFGFFDTMIVVILFVVLIGTGDALATDIAERRREIATLRSMGFAPGAIARMVLAQALAIGIAGVTLAIGFGMGMGLAFVEGVLPSTLGWQLALHPTYGVAALAGLAGVGVCIVAALLPAHRAAHVPIVAALRND